MVYGFLAVVCYVPQLLTHPGVVSDDTKTYLYLDPGRLLRQASSMWDPNVALGTVTHQNIGYLFPMGPFFFVFSKLHVATWVAQRLWMGSILFAAAAGIAYLCRLLGVTGIGRIVAALAYGLSPYVMQYTGRVSVLLLPFSGLPWLMVLIVLAVRKGGWRYPALFALVVAAVSGINASSIVYVGIAPLLYLPFAVFVTREITFRDALGVFFRTGVLTLTTSLWWIAGLVVEGAYGVDILKYTESVEATSSGSSASEVIRGLGYWYFYGGDRIGLWTQSSIELTTRTSLLALSYLVPVGAFISAAFIRWRERAFYMVLIAVGLLLSVGAHPYLSPTPLGSVDKSFMTKTTVGLALRSADRATPVVVLGLAMLLGAGVAAFVRRLPRIGLLGGLIAVVLVLGADAPLLVGESVIPQFSQPAKLPTYVQAAANYLNTVHPGTRVYGLPGDNFAANVYGDTVDPVWPAVLNRPYVTHEQFIQGSLPTANILYALDNPLQQGTFDWTGLAPLARLMSVGNVLVEYDEQYDRYDTPRPSLLEEGLATNPPGLSGPVLFGAPFLNSPSLAMLDETYFDSPQATPHAPLAVYSVSDPRPIERGESLADPLVVDGDNTGIVAAAEAGLLQKNPTILFAGVLDTDRPLARQVSSHPAQLVLTDTNRKQAFEWNSLAENTGYTETAKEGTSAFVVNDPGFRLFPSAGTSSETTSVLTGIRSVSASAYGTALTLRSEFSPANAIDGNLSTAWETEGTSDVPVVGQWWQVALKKKTSADSVTLTQPQKERNAGWLTNQFITKATLTFDGGHPITASLGPESRSASGETIEFPRRSFGTLRIRIDRTNLDDGGPAPVGSSLVGFSEVKIGNVRTTQIVSMPTDLLHRLGRSSLSDRLTILMTRDRVAPVPPRQDPESTIIRQFTLPTARTFSIRGTARVSTQATDPKVDSVIGRSSGLVSSASSSSRMPGNLADTASATLDGDLATMWSPGLGVDAIDDSWLNYTFKSPLSIGQLTLDLASDPEHSVPTSIQVSAGAVTRTVALPTVATTPAPGSVTPVHVSFPPITGSSLRITFTGVAQKSTLSYETSLETALPIGVAEVSIPGVPLEDTPTNIPAPCRDDLLRIDGKAIWTASSGSAAGALAGSGLNLVGCGPDRAGIRLGAGTNLVQTASGATTGFNVDQLALDSAAGGSAVGEPTSSATTSQLSGPVTTHGAPDVRVLHQSATNLALHVSGATKPFLLVLGESINKGWSASVTGGPSLGAPVLVDGFANGWLVDSHTLAGLPGHGGSFDVTMRFTPQRSVNLALLASLLSALVCLAIVGASMIRSRRRRANGPDDVAMDRAVVLDETPLLSSPTTAMPVHRRWVVIAASVVLSGILGLAAGGPAAGAVVAVAVLAALTLSRGRSALALGSAFVLLLGVAEVVRHQVVNKYLPGAGWPSHFSVASTIVLVAIVLLGADATLEIVRRHKAGSSSGPEPAPTD
jgi:arabinofuranan 3-O-arabinosyltransferase